MNTFPPINLACGDSPCGCSRRDAADLLAIFGDPEVVRAAGASRRGRGEGSARHARARPPSLRRRSGAAPGHRVVLDRARRRARCPCSTSARPIAVPKSAMPWRARALGPGPDARGAGPAGGVERSSALQLHRLEADIDPANEPRRATCSGWVFSARGCCVSAGSSTSQVSGHRVLRAACGRVASGPQRVDARVRAQPAMRLRRCAPGTPRSPRCRPGCRA